MEKNDLMLPFDVQGKKDADKNRNRIATKSQKHERQWTA